MGKLTELTMKYSYNDIMVVPAILSSIQHRAECNPYYKDGMLPLFTAPMDSVVNKENFDLFEKHGIIPILPRTESLEDRLKFAYNGKWAAFSLKEFEDEFTIVDAKSELGVNTIRVLIDMANGHVERLYDAVKTAKGIYDDIIEIMVGNIANPETYRVCVESQVDYVRCSVGTGAGCITCSNTAIGYPIASLISEIAAIKQEYMNSGIYNNNSLPKIIADGGIRNYNDIIKAIALGADYVMCGSIFSKMLESASAKVMDRGFSEGGKKIRLRFPIEHYENLRYEDEGWVGDYTDEFIEEMAKNGHKAEKENHAIGTIYAKFYGMASRAGQIAMKGKKVHTSEGIEKMLEVTYTIKTWVENMTDYLQSAMSYTNSRTIDELKQANVVIVSMNTYNSINK
jgi:IMP dehydrogenase/GMP reductase